MGLEKSSLALREVSPKFIKRWATIYVDRFLRDGPRQAIAWGTEFFNPEEVDAIAAEARRLLKLRGIKKPPEGA